MKKFFTYAFILIVSIELSLQLMTWGVQTYAKHSQRSQNEGKGHYRILCIGESTTAMGGDDSYPALLEKILNEKAGKPVFEVINGGISGTTTRVIGNKIPQMIADYNPDVAIVMTGINDYWSLPDNDQQKWEVYLEKLGQYSRTAKLLHIIRTNQKFEVANNIIPKGSCGMADSSAYAVPSSFNNYIGESLEITRKNGAEKAVEFLKNKITFLEENGFCEDAYPIYEQVINYQAKAMNNPKLALQTTEYVLNHDIAPKARETFVKWKNNLRLRLGLPYDNRVYPSATNYWTNFYYKLNFQNIVGLFQKNDIPVIVMQYPQLPIEPIKQVLNNHRGVTFVENKTNFAEALKIKRFDDLFIDSFGKVFGHTTHDGAQLIAENVAQSVLEIIPLK